MPAASRYDLAATRVVRGEIEGATEALAPVLLLPQVRHIKTPSPAVTDLRGALENFTAARLVPSS